MVDRFNVYNSRKEDSLSFLSRLLSVQRNIPQPQPNL